MMEKFAERYCSNNPGVFPTADTAFILSYSIIMLHTDAHTPNIKPEKKMTLKSFLRNNQGINNGADLPPEMLAAIYESICTRPFTLREDDALRSKKAEKDVCVNL
jgi:brefeldin A-inhibited guanine nucleotide-exchange protein